MKNLNAFRLLNEQSILAKKHLVIGAGGENDPKPGEKKDNNGQTGGGSPPPVL